MCAPGIRVLAHTDRHIGLSLQCDPYNLRIEVKEDSIMLQWDQDDVVDGIAIYRSTVPDRYFAGTGISSTGQYVDKDIQPGITYYYQLLPTILD